MIGPTTKTKQKVVAFTEFYFNQNYNLPPTFKEFCINVGKKFNMSPSGIQYYHTKLLARGCIFSIKETQTTRRLLLLSKIRTVKQTTTGILFKLMKTTYRNKKTLHRDLIFLFDKNKIHMHTMNTTNGKTSFIEYNEVQNDK